MYTFSRRNLKKNSLKIPKSLTFPKIQGIYGLSFQSVESSYQGRIDKITQHLWVCQCAYLMGNAVLHSHYTCHSMGESFKFGNIYPVTGGECLHGFHSVHMENGHCTPRKVQVLREVQTNIVVLLRLQGSRTTVFCSDLNLAGYSVM